MALMQVDFFSKVLGMCCQCNVILPQSEQGIGVTGSGELTEKKVPTLWLLHGASGLLRFLSHSVFPLGQNHIHGPLHSQYR